MVINNEERARGQNGKRARWQGSKKDGKMGKTARRQDG
jgi:hypothetical protein